MTQTTTAVWWNYEFTTDLPCPNGCPVPHPLYIGKSSRPDLRFRQHEDAPWRPYATGFFVYPDAYPTEQASLVAEEYRIRTRLPYANKEHNELNPCRLDFGPAPNTRAGRVGTSRRRSNRRWPQPARRLAWGVVVWLVLAVVVFVALPDSTPFGSACEESAFGASLLMALPLLGRRRRRRRRRR